MNIQYAWFHNDSPLSNENNKMLLVKGLSRTQSGTYHCTVSTRYRKQTSAKTNILVNCKFI